ncbi:hypothetical protein FRB91_008767 [Serendipita sp. 411]|nr:hypothetical protein FRB91_008767 [Serendipita sp. 411]
MLKGLDDKSEDAEPDTSGAFPATDNERFRSPLLLADFDSGEDVKDNGEKEPLPRTGTPVFTARMVRNKTCYPAGDDQRSPGPPGVHKRIRRCYKKWHPARVEAYVDVQKEFVTVPDDTKVPGYQHRPGYDAESVFWFLVYWGMLAKPTDGEEKKINRAHWTSLTDPTDDRDRFVRGFPNDFFHPFYEPLKPLIRGMAAHLVVDSDLVTDKRKQEPYYLIEVFKRLILDFIIDNLTESFMVDPKSEKDREVEPDATGVKTSTNIEGTTTYESTNLGADGPENSSNESESNDVESQDEIESGFDGGFTSEAEYFGIKGSERHKYYPMSDGRKQREEKDGMQGVSIGMTASSSSSNVSGKKRKRTSTSAVHSSASSQDKWPGALRRRSSDHLPGTSPSDDEDQSGDYVDKGSFKRRHRRK